MAQAPGILSRNIKNSQLVFTSKVLIIFLYSNYIVTPIHEAGHYIVSRLLGITPVSVQWFVHPWELFKTPNVDYGVILTGINLKIIQFSGLLFGLIFCAITILFLKHFWGAGKWGELLIPLTFMGAANDLFIEPFNLVYQLLWAAYFLILIYRMGQKRSIIQ